MSNGYNSRYPGSQIDDILDRTNNVLLGAPYGVTLSTLDTNIQSNKNILISLEEDLKTKVSKFGDTIDGGLYISRELIVPLINATAAMSAYAAIENIDSEVKFEAILNAHNELYIFDTENRQYKLVTKYNSDIHTYYYGIETEQALIIDSNNNGVVFGPNQKTKIKNDKVYGAIWNDYAEYRESNEFQPGRVVIECGDGKMIRSSKRLQPGAEIISDTFGYIMGETEKCKTPIAVAGRVLAYPYEKYYNYKPGDPVCSGPNGTISKMTRREVRKYPDRIIGTVSEIPTYDTWGEHNISVNGRIWIRIK